MQNTVVIHSKKGKNLQEIAEVAGINKGQLRYEIRKARRIIEEDLLQPAGFCRITEFRDKSVEGLSKNALNQASVNGKLKVVKILGFYYTNKDNINEYLATRRDNVNESQLSEGYIFVGDHVTVAEYAVLRNHTGYRRELLAYVGNRAYIKNEDLEEFRKQRGTRTIKFDEDGNANLSDLAPTAIDYARYLKAVKAGKLNAIRRGNRWLTTPGAIQEYESNKKQTGSFTETPKLVLQLA